ncbi:MAG: ribosome-associated translation inhibitor RaiA [Dehalococcoidia bacterium]|nr:ribosome-associated translation inhibitor RaiA [Dehalococcoidia bacterium]
MEEPVIKGKNVEVSQALREYIVKKVDRLGRHLDRILETKIELAMQDTRSQDDRYAAQITISTNHTTLRAEERGQELRSVVDQAVDSMDRQIDRYKAKRRGKRGSAGKPVPETEELALPPEEADLIRVVKNKRFPMKPMDPEEAAEQMELLGHGFFAFFNASSGNVSVIYRRRDGDYGLLEPELG